MSMGHLVPTSEAILTREDIDSTDLVDFLSDLVSPGANKHVLFNVSGECMCRH